MFRFHRTADMLSDVSRLLAFAADELRDCARAASVADDRACAAIDQADMLQRQLDRLLGQRPELAPTPTPVPGPLPMPECRDEGETPTAPDDAPEGLPAAADVPPLDAPAPAATSSTRTRGRRRKGEGEAPASASGQAPGPDAATEAEAVEQVAQVLGDAPAPRDVSADLFGPAAADDDFPPL